VAASAFLATTQASAHPAGRIVATVILGLPGLAAFIFNTTDLLGRPLGATRRKVKRSLQSGLVQISRDGLLPGDDVTLASFHVWLIPKWYRLLLPRRLRRMLDRNSSRMPGWLRPHLSRYAVFRFQHLDSSGVTFRKGTGVAGRCIEENLRDRVKVVRLTSQAFRSALSTEERWDAAPSELTHGLPYQDAKSLARAYGQVAAMVMRERSGEAIGCVTLDLHPSIQTRLPNVNTQIHKSPLYSCLHNVAGQVANHLTRQ
jgi:hypothetical protein